MYAHRATNHLHTRRTLLGLGICLTLWVSSLLAGCGGSSDVSAPQKTLRGDRYCEVLLVSVNAGLATGEVWNTYPLNDCPQATWSTLNAANLAIENKVPRVVLNGPRYWLMNSVEKAGGAVDLPKKNFGGLEMYRQATVELGPVAQLGSAKPYVPSQVDRSATFIYDAGARVYELRATDGATYVMQTYSAQIDSTLTEAQLTDLGSRLKLLPAGWTYSSRILDSSLKVETVTSVARVLQDELGNSYSEWVKN
jgi:hypothetical protein